LPQHQWRNVEIPFSGWNRRELILFCPTKGGGVKTLNSPPFFFPPSGRKAAVFPPASHGKRGAGEKKIRRRGAVANAEEGRREGGHSVYNLHHCKKRRGVLIIIILSNNARGKEVSGPLKPDRRGKKVGIAFPSGREGGGEHKNFRRFSPGGKSALTGEVVNLGSCLMIWVERKRWGGETTSP